MKQPKAIQLFFLMGFVINGCEVLAADDRPNISEKQAEEFHLAIEIAKSYLSDNNDDMRSLCAMPLNSELLKMELKEKRNDVVNITVETLPPSESGGGIPDMSQYPRARIKRMLLAKILEAYQIEAETEEDEKEPLDWKGWGKCAKGEYHSLDEGTQCRILRNCCHAKLNSYDALNCNVTVPRRVYDALEESLSPKNESILLDVQSDTSSVG